ncbi:hypothetical protein [Aeromicrobium duanguangcaii]|uniref:hypothetical protein n=1 Tax=Aeromicrobium duanguangcaii TaxID=2968086 RepID=UPI002016AB7B|nr:hypothetical protein [Aeromicrobium duanguangcaii]MCL3838787.1 hypothetical protein [Aeromicrobium duanguangcaii]
MRRYTTGIVAGVLTGGLLAALPITTAQAATNADLATALDLPTGITLAQSGDARGFAVATTTFNDFPSRFGNGQYAVLSTGEADDLFDRTVPGLQASTDLAGEDTVSLTFNVGAQSVGSCLLVDVAMGTEERVHTYAEGVPSDTISLKRSGDDTEYAKHAGVRYFGQLADPVRDSRYPEPKPMSVNAIQYWHGIDQEFERQPDDHAAPLLPAVTPLDHFTSVETFEVPVQAGASVTLSISDANNETLDSVALVDRVRTATRCSWETSAATGLTPLRPSVVVGHRGVENILTVDLNPATAEIERYDAAANGWHPGGVDLRFRWYRYWIATANCNDGLLANWVPIPDADRQSFSPTVNEKGACLMVVVTGKKDGYRSESFPSPASAQWDPTLQIQDGVFTNTAVPTITSPHSGIRVNDVLTATTGTFTPRPDTYSYQWYSDEKLIFGESGQTFKVTAAQAGTRISVRVTAKRRNFDDMPILSALSVPVTNLDFTTVGTPVLDGSGAQGEPLTIRPGTWVPAVATNGFEYEWYADDVKIPSQTRASYTPPVSMIGKRIHAVVRGTKAGYNPQSRQTSSISIVGAGFTAGRVVIAGTPRVGEKLVATASGWAPTTPSKRTFVWKVGGQILQDGALNYLKVPESAVGKSIHVEVRGERSGFAPITVASPLTRVVARGVLKSSAPRISGTARPKKTLRASVTWSPAPVTYRYQWYVGKKKIARATKSSYKVPKKYRGKKIRVRVTGTKSGYTTVARYSAYKKIAKK